RNPFHTLLTETHSVAAGTHAPSLVEIPFSALGQGVRTVTASVLEIDTEHKLVLTDEAGNLPYDTLAFCLGGKDNDFGTPGVQEHALFLRGQRDAEVIRTRLEQLTPGAGVVIVGGGLTGVELAAEIAMRTDIHPAVTVVEAMPTLLPGLVEGLQQRARRRLGWLGVNVLTGGRVAKIEEGKVCLADGAILSAGLIVWAAGVQGNPLVRQLGLSTDRSGRVSIGPDLLTGKPEILVLGDSAAYTANPGERSLPPSAQLAEQMGFGAAANLAARLRGHAARPFVPHLQGILCDLGGLNASGLVFRWQIHGKLGAVAKRFTVLRHLWKTMGLKGFMINLTEQLHALTLPAQRHESR
ncbi:MAG: NAD(P)/FAD-dependent oxidoreductase, partial [Mycobacterium leprae]